MQAVCKRVRQEFVVKKAFDPANPTKPGKGDNASPWLNKEKITKEIESQFGIPYSRSISVDINGQIVKFNQTETHPPKNNKGRNSKFNRFLKNHYESVNFKP